MCQVSAKKKYAEGEGEKKKIMVRSKGKGTGTGKGDKGNCKGNIQYLTLRVTLELMRGEVEEKVDDHSDI